MRHQLHAGGAGTDQDDVLAREFVVLRPCGRMKHFAGETLYTLDVGQLGRTEQTTGADDEIGLERPLLAIGSLYDYLPPCLGRVPLGFPDLGAEHDAVEYSKFTGAMMQIFFGLTAGRKEFCPRIFLLELVLIDEARGIDTHAGIRIEVPRTAEVRLPLDDGVGNSQPLQLNGSGQPADAGADHHDIDMRERRGRRLLRPSNVAGEIIPCGFLVGKGELLVGQRSMAEILHGFANLSPRRRGWYPAALRRRSDTEARAP